MVHGELREQGPSPSLKLRRAATTEGSLKGIGASVRDLLVLRAVRKSLSNPVTKEGSKSVSFRFYIKIPIEHGGGESGL